MTAACFTLRALVEEIRAALLTRKAFESKGKGHLKRSSHPAPPLTSSLPHWTLLLHPAAKDWGPKLPWEGTEVTAGPLRGRTDPQLDVYETSCSPHYP